MTLLVAQAVTDMASKLETQVWVLTGLTGFLVIAIIGAAKYIGSALITRVDKISDVLEEHNTQLIKVLTGHKYQDEKIDEIKKEVAENTKDIHSMQLNCANNNHSPKRKIG